MRTLDSLGVGEEAVIRKLHGQGAVRRRMMDMGLTRGTAVLLRKLAPLGDPMELNIRGFELSLRKADAQQIEIDQA